MEIGAVLQAARRRAGLTLRELAELADTSHSTLVAYEQGRRVPRADTLIRVLDAAGVALVPTSAQRADHTFEARRAKGEELIQALRLAGTFPSRHSEQIDYPRFGRAA